MTDSQVWVLVKNGKSAEEVATLQEKDIEVYGLGHVLETLIPLEHRSAAELSGRWDEEHARRMKGIPLRCHKCGHIWTYRGRSHYRTTCPACHITVYLDKCKIVRGGSGA